MKKCFFISALVVGVVVVGLSEPHGAIIPKENDMPGAAIQDDWTVSWRKKRPEARNRVSEKEKREGEEQGYSSVKRNETGRRRVEKNDSHQESEMISPQVSSVAKPPIPSESEYLKEIASALSIPVSKDDTPGDIAFKIKQRIGYAERYRGEVLSDESFELAKSAIGIPKDAETFKTYHAFVKKIAGKRIMIFDDIEKVR